VWLGTSGAAHSSRSRASLCRGVKRKG
jgi:hypothetical protein